MAFNVANPNAIDRPFRDSLVRMPPIKMMTDGDESTTFNLMLFVQRPLYLAKRLSGSFPNLKVYIYNNIYIWCIAM